MVRCESGRRVVRRQVGTDQVDGIGKPTGRPPGSLHALPVSGWIVWGASFTSRAIEGRELRWADPPITALLLRHDVEMWGGLEPAL